MLHLSTFCLQCGKTALAAARFCSGCGRPLPSPRLTNDSNSETDDDASAKLLHYIQSISADGELIRRRDFSPPLSGKVNATALDSVLSLAEDQFCRWNIKWLWSPSDAPDTVAAEEQEAWWTIYEMFARQLSSIHSEMDGVIRRHLQARTAATALSAKIARDAKAPLRQIEARVSSFLCVCLDLLGLHGLAVRTANRWLFPPASVGRNQ
jgi:hypothetical protein